MVCTMASSRLLRGALLVAGAAAATSKPPHLIYVLADDFGYFDVSFRNPAAHTPHIDALVADGLQLRRFYTFQFCSPTRSSFLSGRLPIHVNTENNPTSKPGGVDLRMTLLSEKLRALGYYTGVSGKWHAGGHVQGQLPVQRGFDRSRVFLNGNEDHYSHWFGIDKGFDMWQDSANLYDNSTYGAELYVAHALQTIADFNASTHAALFMYIPFQNTHAPFQVPARYENPARTPHGNKRTYLGMGSCMDEGIGNITAALKARGLWENTLLVFSADNGGEITTGGNNFPLRGGKYTDFEGGTRNVALAAGGFLAPELRNSSTDAVLHIADMWASFASLAGDPAPTTDEKTAAWNLAHPDDLVPAADSVDASAVFRVAGAASGRTEVPLSLTALIDADGKKIVTEQAGGRNFYTAPDWPAFDGNGSAVPKELGAACSPFCIFDVDTDPSERDDLAATVAGKAIAARLQPRLAAIAATHWETGDHAFLGDFTNCTTMDAFKAAHKGYLGPVCYPCLVPPCSPTPGPTPPPPPTPPPTPRPPQWQLQRNGDASACLAPPASSPRTPVYLTNCTDAAAHWELTPAAAAAAAVAEAPAAAAAAEFVSWWTACLRPDSHAVEASKCAAGVAVYIGKCSDKCPGMQLRDGKLQSTGCPGFCAVPGDATGGGGGDSGSFVLGSCDSSASGGWAAVKP